MLRQGARLLASASDADYVRPAQRCFGSTMGGHIRHVVEHYGCLVAGIPRSRVDYDARERNQEIETRRELGLAALERMADLMEQMQAAADTGAAVSVRVDTGTSARWAGSTVGRELQFVLSHTVHHYSLISVICQLHDLPTEADFGVAPSTLRARVLAN